MIGEMIGKVRKERRMSKTELARLTGINIGHLTHIEKGERNPSHKALKNICRALNVPYQQIMYTYGKSLNEEQASYGLIEHIAHNRVPAIDNITSFVECPASIPSANFALKVKDASMEPVFKANDYIFVELNSLLDEKEIGVFALNDKILVRRFSSKQGAITLKADNAKFESVKVKEEDEFYIIGKVLGR